MMLMFILCLIVLGLILGSFANALIWRLHEQERHGNNQKLSILHGRSICPSCKHQLAPRDLIPLVSWLVLRGKCRYCHKQISFQYPLVELLTAGLFVFSYIFWPISLHGLGMFTFCCWLLFLTGFITLSVYDLRWFKLPNKLIFPLVILALIQLTIALIYYHAGWSLMFSDVWGAILLGGVFYILFQVSSGQWIGGGDVKLGVLLGLIVGGIFNSVVLLFTASATGTLLALPLIAAGKAHKNSMLPFGPLLIVGAIIAQLFGASLNHYLRIRGF